LKVDPEGVARWVHCRVIALEKALPIDDPIHRARVLVVRVDDSTFMLELKSGQVKKVTNMPRYFADVLPFMSFYIPGTYIASTLFIIYIYMVLHFIAAAVLLLCCVSISLNGNG